ncbi:unnamed protein product [Trichogramma brassicae]|uniref:Uncharacterized protein n=1 Tax=Trichogramma brassicae TaxID=86971 RepID=A0A6H5IU98_9HYME|nr:unnamed protein product [Trichogramma brassicae]
MSGQPNKHIMTEWKICLESERSSSVRAERDILGDVYVGLTSTARVVRSYVARVKSASAGTSRPECARENQWIQRPSRPLGQPRVDLDQEKISTSCGESGGPAFGHCVCESYAPTRPPGLRSSRLPSTGYSGPLGGRRFDLIMPCGVALEGLCHIRVNTNNALARTAKTSRLLSFQLARKGVLKTSTRLIPRFIRLTHQHDPRFSKLVLWSRMMAAAMEGPNTVNMQTQLRRTLTWLARSIIDRPLAEWTTGHIRSLRTLLDGYWNDFMNNHVQLVEIPKIQQDAYFQEDVYAEVGTTVLDSQARLIDVEVQHHSERTDDSRSGSSAYALRRPARLPRIELKEFDGTPREWESFRDLFRFLVHNDPRLTDVERLHYLKSSVKGDAATAIQGFEVTAQNYESAWEALLSRYDNPVLPTAMIVIGDGGQRQEKLRALLDPCSEATLVTTSIARRLSAHLKRVQVSISGTSGVPIESARVRACLYLHDTVRERQLPIEVYGLQRIGIRTPSQLLPPAMTKRFQELELADPEPHTPRPVDAILGADVYNKILLPGLV